MKTPPKAYLKRNIELVAVMVRIEKSLKKEMDLCVKEYKTSNNKFMDSAIRWYIAALREWKEYVRQEETKRLHERIKNLRAALSFIACEGMDDADFYAEHDITSGTIAMANRARDALAQDDAKEEKK